jgi:hypothetical protein
MTRGGRGRPAVASTGETFGLFGAPVAGNPTVVSRGWSVERIPEPNIVLALALLGGSGMLFTKKLRSM